MEKRIGLQIATCISSFFVLTSGIVFITLMKYSWDNIPEGVDLGHHINYYGEIAYLYWASGFVFIFTGFFGMLMACARSKKTYISYMCFGIIALVIKGVSFVYAMQYLSALSSYLPRGANCNTVGDGCVCDTVWMYYGSCDNIDMLHSILIGILAIVVIGWICILTSIIISGILACMCLWVHAAVSAGHFGYLTLLVSKEVLPVVVDVEPQMSSIIEMAFSTSCPKTSDKAQLVSNMTHQP